METIIKNKKIAIIIAIIVVLGTVLLGAYHQSVNRYSSKIAVQIDNVETVINVNLPEESKEYLHRAGRCGRNGQEGLCVSIITENELNKIKKYQKEFKINVVQKRLYNGKLVAK